MKRIVLLLLLLLPFMARAQHERQVLSADSFKYTPEGRDTLRYMSFLNPKTWEVTVKNNDGTVRSFVSMQPDTINAGNAAAVSLTALFRVLPNLLQRNLSLNYELSGSVRVLLNGKPVLATGAFAVSRDAKASGMEPSGFVHFLLNDTLEKAEITYIPHPRMHAFDLRLIVFDASKAFDDYYWFTETYTRILTFSLGFYYLSFAAIFLMMFFFFRENRENLYFSLFAFFISISFFISTFDTLACQAVAASCGVLATEFACSFLAKVFRNRQRTKAPLIACIIICGVCLIPSVLYRQVSLPGGLQSLGMWTTSSLLFLYELYLTGYILIWGLRRRNRDSNTIFIFSIAATALYVVLPLTGYFVPAFKNLSFVSYWRMLPTLGLCVFPIGYAIVLGRRNGDAQRQLLEKEKEKKRILEEQNEVLEREVAIRTREVVQQKQEIEQQHRALVVEKKKSDDLLLNILPGEVAEELKETGHSQARFFNDVTVLFTDFVDFTAAGSRMTPQELVDELHACFKAFDEIATRHGIEKIKTIGDAYMAICGLPLPDAGHALHVVQAAQEILEFMGERKKLLQDKTFHIRIGVHSGSVVAGIVGVKKFAYDIWGDTVNTAARMEQNSEAGKINISAATYELIKDKIRCTSRGAIDVKGKGMTSMYYVDQKNRS